MPPADFAFRCDGVCVCVREIYDFDLFEILLLLLIIYCTYCRRIDFFCYSSDRHASRLYVYGISLTGVAVYEAGNI